MTNMADYIDNLSMKIDEKYLRPQLIEALKMYHTLIQNDVIKPRENQLNSSGTIPEIIHFNK